MPASTNYCCIYRIYKIYFDCRIKQPTNTKTIIKIIFSFISLLLLSISKQWFSTNKLLQFHLYDFTFLNIIVCVCVLQLTIVNTVVAVCMLLLNHLRVTFCVWLCHLNKMLMISTLGVFLLLLLLLSFLSRCFFLKFICLLHYLHLWCPIQCGRWYRAVITKIDVYAEKRIYLYVNSVSGGNVIE